jgi:hypothetical protein
MEFFTQRILQIEEGLYLEAPLPLEPSDCFNHSCEPNVGFTGQIGLLAMRDIHAGEELTSCAMDRIMMSLTVIAEVKNAAGGFEEPTGRVPNYGRNIRATSCPTSQDVLRSSKPKRKCTHDAVLET